jgi:pyrroline-5-carboxylate reductase
MKIGVIGCGNIGFAMVQGILSAGKIPKDKLYAYDINQDKVTHTCQTTGAMQAKSEKDLAKEADVLVLAVKPHSVKKVLEEIREAFTPDKILVSVAVGIPIAFYEKVLGESAKIVRTMPNLPIQVGEGMTLMCTNSYVKPNDLKSIQDLFLCVGKVSMLDERLMSEVTALTASSPAYVFMMMEAMADAAVLSGIPRELSYQLAAQAILGSAKMLLHTHAHPAQLKDWVCSPAGTTIEAVYHLEKNKFRHVLMDAMGQCTKKAREIGERVE